VTMRKLSRPRVARVIGRPGDTDSPGRGKMPFDVSRHASGRIRSRFTAGLCSIEETAMANNNRYCDQLESLYGISAQIASLRDPLPLTSRSYMRLCLVPGPVLRVGHDAAGRGV